ncbi:UNVERIFIED_CONTAM: hypothetical protein K2H54_066813, partial [Gekko kuhli]
MVGRLFAGGARFANSGLMPSPAPSMDSLPTNYSRSWSQLEQWQRPRFQPSLPVPAASVFWTLQLPEPPPWPALSEHKMLPSAELGPWSNHLNNIVLEKQQLQGWVPQKDLVAGGAEDLRGAGHASISSQTSTIKPEDGDTQSREMTALVR